MSSPIQEFPDLDGLLNVLVGPILDGVPRWSMSGGHQPLLQGPRPIRAGRHADLQSTAKRGGLDRAQLPIELALDALDGADADLMLGGELADAGAALLPGVPDFALDGDRDR